MGKLAWLGLTALVTLVMWAAQVHPDRAVSNIYGWLQKVGIKDPPQWLLDRAADGKVRVGAYIALLLLAVWGGAILDGLFRPSTPIAGAPGVAPTVWTAAPLPPSHYGIAWNFDDPARADVFYLGGGKERREEARVSSFQAYGKNISDDFISCTRGDVRSDLTGKIISLFFVLQPTGEKIAVPSANAIAPQTPFLIMSEDFDTLIQPDADKPHSGIRISKFISEFGGFYFSFECDKGTYRHHFSTDDIRELATKYDKFLEIKPQITKKSGQ